MPYYVARVADACVIRAYARSNGVRYLFSTASPPTRSEQGLDAGAGTDENKDGSKESKTGGEGALSVDLELPALPHVRLRKRDGSAGAQCARVPPLEALHNMVVALRLTTGALSRCRHVTLGLISEDTALGDNQNAAAQANL